MLRKRNILKALFVILLINAFISNPTVRADILLNVPFFSQVDEKWDDDIMVDGLNPTMDIHNFGCMITSFAMVLYYYGVDTNSQIFNNWLRNNEGYVTEGVNAGFVNWQPGVKNYAKENGINVIPASLITSQNNELIHNELIAGYPVIVKVPYANDHWMIVVEERNGQFYCWDPLDPPENTETVSINKYGAYSKYLTVHGPIHQSVIKFSDSSTVYLKSEVGKLWPILNEQTYILLGYRNEDCVSFVSDWGYVTELPESEKSNYSITARAIPSQNDYQWNNLIAYKVVEKVGPVSCISYDNFDKAKIYFFGSDNKFHHITNEQVYYDLGYNPDWSEVVEISPDLFMQYGEGDAITEETFTVEPIPIFLGNYTEEPPLGAGVYPPEDLIATIISPTQIDLSWNKGLNPPEYDDNLRYRIYKSVNQGGYYSLADGLVNGNYSAVNLNAETEYCFKISAYLSGSEEESDFSNIACATINSSPQEPYVDELFTCKGIDQQGTTNADYVGFSISFDNPSEDIFLYLKLQGNYPNNLYFRFELTKPGGQITSNFNPLGNKIPDNQSYWITYANLETQENNLFSYPGYWQANVYYGYEVDNINIYLTNFQFEIKRLPISPIQGFQVLE